jgi:hypothetical protein
MPYAACRPRSWLIFDVSQKMKVRAALFTVSFGVVAFAEEATVSASAEQWIAAVAALKKEVPEFAEFCTAFGAAQIRTYQMDKKVPVLTITLRGEIGERYTAFFIYEVSYKSKFTEVGNVISEHLGVNRNAELKKLKQGQALPPLNLKRSDLPKVAAEGEAYLDRLFSKGK